MVEEGWLEIAFPVHYLKAGDNRANQRKQARWESKRIGVQNWTRPAIESWAGRDSASIGDGPEGIRTLIGFKPEAKARKSSLLSQQSGSTRSKGPPFCALRRGGRGSGKVYYPIHAIGIRSDLRVKVARRYQITIPEEVREEVGINVGDAVDVRSQDGKVVVEKVGKSWESVMGETQGAWKAHPIFKDMKDSLEIVDWLRQKRRKT